MNILVTGKTGTGKSALINSIAGSEVTAEGDTLKPQTKQIEHTVRIVGDVKLQVWDSPGLQDGTKSEDDYVREIATQCSGFDLIVYTIRMSQRRVLKNDADCRAMQILSRPKALGPNMWHNVIIVLTFANIVESMAKYKFDKSDLSPVDIKIEKIFKEEFESAVKAIRTILIDSVGLSKKLAESVPIVPAGYCTDPATLPVYKKSDTCDGKRYYWLSDLWLKALSVTKLDAQPAMIKLNENRMVESRKEYDGQLHATKSAIAKQMPLIFGAKGAQVGKRMYSIFSGFGTTMGALTGSGLGHFMSFAVLADQGHKNEILTDEEYQELKRECECRDAETLVTAEGFEIIPEYKQS